MKQAMIFAAGLGTRLKPITDTMPKALVPVGGEPLLQRVLMKLKDAGFERVVINVHHFAEQIVCFLRAKDMFGMDIHISYERNMLLETGGGIKKASSMFDATSPFL
ncbi:MAG: NTP transferase domain-containing protein, partial [Prevotella sp.]|nr:NTP transferase domain-containing protein [Prevotella sp.]